MRYQIVSDSSSNVFEHGANRLGGNAVADFVVFGRIAGAQAAALALEEALEPAA